MAPTDDDVIAVEALLGRPIRGDFEVVVRHDDGSPLVIRNAPLLDDGTPMPTRYWLVGEPERTWIGRLEGAGGVDRAEAEVDAAELAAAHDRYRRARCLPARRVGGAHAERWGGGHAHRREVPARPLRLAARRRRRPGGSVGRGPPRRGPPVTPSAGERVAALDCGTNSTRLLVAEPDGDGGFRTLEPAHGDHPPGAGRRRQRTPRTRTPSAGRWRCWASTGR